MFCAVTIVLWKGSTHKWQIWLRAFWWLLWCMDAYLPTYTCSVSEVDMGGHPGLSIKVTTQLKTSVNSWEHRKTSKIIWYHPEKNWGPHINNLVQFEEDFNSRTEMWWWGPVGLLSQTSPIPRSPDGDKNVIKKWVNTINFLGVPLELTSYRLFGLQLLPKSGNQGSLPPKQVIYRLFMDEIDFPGQAVDFRL